MRIFCLRLALDIRKPTLFGIVKILSTIIWAMWVPRMFGWKNLFDQLFVKGWVGGFFVKVFIDWPWENIGASGASVGFYSIVDLLFGTVDFVIKSMQLLSDNIVGFFLFRHFIYMFWIIYFIWNEFLKIKCLTLILVRAC